MNSDPIRDAGKWRERRKLLTPSFHLSVLEDAVPIVSDQISVFFNLVELNGGKVDDLYSSMSAFAMDVICGECGGAHSYVIVCCI